MTELLPGFGNQLERRAQRMADDHGTPSRAQVDVTGDGGPRRPGHRRRLHGRGLAVAVLVTAAGVSGVAYAAQGLWSPPMGDQRTGGATATASELPGEMLKAFGVMRREQTAADRGAGSRFALSMNGRGAVVRTNAVRRLATGLGGGAIVLVPYETKESMDLEAVRRSIDRAKLGKEAPPVPTEIPTVVKRDEVCVSYLDGYTGAGVACQGLDGLLQGKLTMGKGFEPCLTPSSRRNFAMLQANERKLAVAEGRRPVRMSCGRERGRMQQFSMGVVPDGVAAVKFSRSPSGIVVPVRGNVWQSSRGSLRPAVWLDAQGRELSKRLADTRARLGLPATGPSLGSSQTPVQP